MYYLVESVLKVRGLFTVKQEIDEGPALFIR